MKFQLIVLGFCLIFYIRFCKLQKASGITPEKCCRYQLANLLRLLLNKTFAIQKRTGGSTFRETITHRFLRFWNWAKKTVSAAKICGGANVVKTGNPANIRKWIARFYYFEHYAPLEAQPCITHNDTPNLPIDMGNSSCTAHSIYFWVPSSCFCILIQPLSLR